MVRRRARPRRLARDADPIALGEQLYAGGVAEFFGQRAIHWVQPDVTRMAGITDVLQVCDSAQSQRLPVAPHARDMSQVHVHLSYAHPACGARVHPVDQALLHRSAEVVDGHFRMPSEPGAGTTPTPQAWERYRQPAD